MSDPVLIAIVLAAVVPVASLTAGVLLGAWLMHRARTGQSPLPTLPRPRRGQPADPAPEPRRSNP